MNKNFNKLINDIPLIFFKGFVSCLAIGLLLEIFGVDLLASVSLKTHFFEIAGSVFIVGLPIHYFLWNEA